MYEEYFNRKRIEQYVEQCVAQQHPYFYLSAITTACNVRPQQAVAILDTLIADQVLTMGYQHLSRLNTIYTSLEDLLLEEDYSDDDIVVVYQLTDTFTIEYKKHLNE